MGGVEVCLENWRGGSGVKDALGTMLLRLKPEE